MSVFSQFAHTHSDREFTGQPGKQISNGMTPSLNSMCFPALYEDADRKTVSAKTPDLKRILYRVVTHLHSNEYYVEIDMDFPSSGPALLFIPL